MPWSWRRVEITTKKTMENLEEKGGKKVGSLGLERGSVSWRSKVS